MSPTRPTQDPVVQRPADGDDAIRAEYNHACAAGTEQALSAFLRRHPGHPLQDPARRRLADLRRSSPGSQGHPSKDI